MYVGDAFGIIDIISLVHHIQLRRGRQPRQPWADGEPDEKAGKEDPEPCRRQ